MRRERENYTSLNERKEKERRGMSMPLAPMEREQTEMDDKDASVSSLSRLLSRFAAYAPKGDGR